MEQISRRTFLVHSTRGVAALVGVTALLTRATGVAASTDKGTERPDRSRRHEHHDRHHHHHARHN